MASLYTEDFEGAFPGSWTKFGTQQASSTQDATVFNGGANSYKVDTTGASGTSAMQRTPTSARMRVIRFYFRVDTAPGGTCTIWSTGGANMRFTLTSTRLLKARIASTDSSTSVTLTAGQWYLIDARFDSSGATATIDWAVDGAAQTQHTLTQTATDMTTDNVGQNSSQTIKAYWDDIAADDDSASYPLGAVGGATTDAPAENAPGAGAAANASETLQPNAGNSAGTGAAANAGKTLAASIQASAGTGAAQNATGTQSQDATAELASGTGAAAFGIGGVLVSASGVAAGGSAALDAEAGTSTDVLASTATGTGAAANAAMNLMPTAQAALGTESLVALATDAFGRTVASGLGTADSGQAWTTTGTASAYNVGSGAATFDHTTVTQARRAWLPSVVAHDVDQTFKVKAPAPTTGVHDIFIQLRQTAADGDYLMPKLRIGTDLSMTLSLNRRAVGVETELASVVLQGTFTADAFYTIRTRLMGQGLFAKAWKTSDSEPTGWQVQATDTQIDAPGGIGMRTYSPSGTYPFSFTWDDLDSDEITGSQAYNAAPVPQTFTYAIASAAVGTGSVNDSFAALNAPLQAASGTGSVSTPSFTTAASIEFAEGTGTAYDAVNAQYIMAGLPAGTGTASGLSALVSFSAASAEGGGDAFNTAFELVVEPGIAAGTGVAYDAVNTHVTAGLSTGTGAALGLSALVSFSAAAAVGTAAAFNSGFGLSAATGIATGTGVAYNASTTVVEPLAGYGTIGFRAASGTVTFRSARGGMTFRDAGGSMTIGGS